VKEKESWKKIKRNRPTE